MHFYYPFFKMIFFFLLGIYVIPHLKAGLLVFIKATFLVMYLSMGEQPVISAHLTLYQCNL